MQKITQVECIEYVCDTCGCNLTMGIPITLSFGYDHSLDGTICHFCSTEHLLSFMNAEVAKEK